MKWTTTLLPLAALSHAVVLPSEHLKIQNPASLLDRLSGKTRQLAEHIEHVVSQIGENALDVAFRTADFEWQESLAAGWLDSAKHLAGEVMNGHHGKHGKHGKHGHHDKPNRTIYELINESKYTTTLARYINEYPDIVEALNGTARNMTIFAPTDEAFEKLPKACKPSKELIKKILAYHISPDFYPAGRVLVTHTIPTTFGEEHLGGQPQRLRLGLGLKGLTVNFYARIVAVDIFGTNGVIHGVDHVIMLPVQASKLVSLLPSEFSTFELALEKTELWQGFAGQHHNGATLFAPSNWAFTKLGHRLNMFLFSAHGKKYLKAILQYHFVPRHTLYSDAYYPAKHDDDGTEGLTEGLRDIPKGKYHLDLETDLAGKSLSVDIARFGGFISMKVNGFASVSVQDGIARDGVVHELESVLLPPKVPGGAFDVLTEDMSVDDLVARLDEHLEL